MRQSTTLMVNTGAAFLRMAITFGMGLVVTRFIYQALGVDDFGLFMVLGAGSQLLALVTTVLGASVGRHLTVEIATRNTEQFKIIFNTAFVVFISLGALVWLIGYLLTPMLLRMLEIDADRLNTAYWVFQFLLINLAVSISTSPFRAVIVAQQKIYAFTILDVLSAVLSLVLATLLLYVLKGDLLFQYSLWSVVIHVLTPLTILVVVLWTHPQCHPDVRLFNWGRLREIVSFASWMLVMQAGIQIRDRGSMILMNMKFGQPIDGAYGISVRASGYQQRLTTSIAAAVQPALTNLSHLHENNPAVTKLVLSANKYFTIISLFIAVPVCLDPQLALELWLGKVEEIPPTAFIFLQLTLTWLTLSCIGRGFAFAMQAMGNIAVFASVICGLTLGTLGTAALVFMLSDAPPQTYMYIGLCFATVAQLFSVFYVGPMVGVTFGMWLRRSIWPVLLVLVLAGGPTLAVNLLMEPVYWRFFLEVVVFAVIAMPVGWFLALEDWEKVHISRVFRSALSRLRK